VPYSVEAHRIEKKKMLQLFKKGANINRNRLEFCHRQVWFCRPVGTEKAGPNKRAGHQSADINR
jgi:hypothetical protein